VAMPEESATAVTSDVPAIAADLTNDFVLGKCDYFTEVQLWPLWKEINPRLWLSNFLESEQRHARYLLNAFLYMSAPVVEQIVLDSVEILSCGVTLPVKPVSASLKRWQDFVDGMRVVLVRGEVPSPTDSAYMFSRIARDSLGLPEDRILDVPEALRQLKSGLNAPIVFLDDFVGSGDQFIETWTFEWPVDGSALSFETLAPGRGPFFYCPVLATTYGIGEIEKHCSNVSVVPGHALPPHYSAFHPDSLLWPDDLRSTAEEVIRAASVRAGIPDLDGGSGDWRGYHKLGLAVGFAHGVPDAALPIYWWESETWNPLKKRPYEP